MSGTPLLLVPGRVSHLVLNDPPRNEMDRRFFEAFSRLAGELPGLDTEGLVVRGAGRHFSSGASLADLEEIITGGETGSREIFFRRASAAFAVLAGLPYPTVAAVGGVCFGSGLELALACRARVAAANAVFALPETGFGIMPGCGGTVRLPALVGVGRAVELILSARTVAADEALAIGLVEAVADSRSLAAAAEALLIDGCREAT